MDMDQTVCHCHDVDVRQIKAAMDNGAETLEEVQDATGAGTGCGGCIDEIKEVMAKLAEK